MSGGTPTLWHYTCGDHDAEIERDGLLKPSLGLVWLTDLAEPDRAGLGLTSRILKCDRTAHRFRVLDATQAQPWAVARRSLRPTWVEALEHAPGARPEHWWVARVPVPAVRDER